MTAPTVHLNGTSRDALVEQRTDVLNALRDVEKAIGDAWPNGRDFYPQGPDALTTAQAEWRERLVTLGTMRDEITEETHAILDQG